MSILICKIIIETNIHDIDWPYLEIMTSDGNYSTIAKITDECRQMYVFEFFIQYDKNKIELKYDGNKITLNLDQYQTYKAELKYEMCENEKYYFMEI